MTKGTTLDIWSKFYKEKDQSLKAEAADDEEE